MTPQEKARAKRLVDCFGLTVSDWDKINEYQQGLCYFCHKPQKSGKRLATDHRHNDGLCRGLLDSQCNRLLGKIESTGWTIETLRRVIEYLQEAPATKALGREVYGYPGRVGTKKHRIFLRRKAKISINRP
jgi:hypothetical protein